jgi:hypothetical protein
VILRENPLEDIRNSYKIDFVMINGRLFDAETMDEHGADKMRPKFWWQMPHGENFGPDGNAETFFARP